MTEINKFSLIVKYSKPLEKFKNQNQLSKKEGKKRSQKDKKYQSRPHFLGKYSQLINKYTEQHYSDLTTLIKSGTGFQ